MWFRQPRSAVAGLDIARKFEDRAPSAGVTLNSDINTRSALQNGARCLDRSCYEYSSEIMGGPVHGAEPQITNDNVKQRQVRSLHHVLCTDSSSRRR